MIGTVPSDPQAGPLVAAVSWVANLLTGSLGTIVAVLAIAGVGLALLQGYIPARRVGLVFIGCFVLFGARSIAGGLIGVTARYKAVEPVVAQQPVNVPPKVSAPPPFDPYAGAALPGG